MVTGPSCLYIRSIRLKHIPEARPWNKRVVIGRKSLPCPLPAALASAAAREYRNNDRPISRTSSLARLCSRAAALALPFLPPTEVTP